MVYHHSPHQRLAIWWVSPFSMESHITNQPLVPPHLVTTPWPSVFAACRVVAWSSYILRSMDVHDFSWKASKNWHWTDAEFANWAVNRCFHSKTWVENAHFGRFQKLRRLVNSFTQMVFVNFFKDVPGQSLKWYNSSNSMHRLNRWVKFRVWSFLQVKSQYSMLASKFWWFIIIHHLNIGNSPGLQPRAPNCTWKIAKSKPDMAMLLQRIHVHILLRIPNEYNIYNTILEPRAGVLHIVTLCMTKLTEKGSRDQVTKPNTQQCRARFFLNLYSTKPSIYHHFFGGG